MLKPDRVLPPVLAGLTLLTLWQAIHVLGQVPAWKLPGPLEVATAAWEHRRALALASIDTLLGASAGFLAATVVGFSLAVGLCLFPTLRRAFYPWVVVLQMTPIIAVSAIFVVWLGPGLPSVALTAFVIAFFPVVANTTHGLLSVDRCLVDFFRTCRASRWQEMRHLRVPAATPFLLTGMEVAATLAVIGAIAGELFAGSATGSGGLGFLIIVFKSQIKTPALIATALTACILGFLFVLVVRAIKSRSLRHWHASALPPD